MLNKLHFKIAYLTSFIKRKIWFILITIIIGFSALFFRREIVNFVNLPIFKQESIGIEGLYTLKNLPDDIANQISYGLTVNSKNDKAIISPIVESLSVENENKDYIFTLKESIFWHNGKKLIASDVDYSSISGIKISTLDENKIKVSLEKEFSPILSVLSKPLFKKNTIGLGQYKIKKYSLQEGYLKTLYLTPTKDNLSKKIYRFYQNETDLINAYKLGDVDQIKITSLPEELSKWSNSKITQKIETNEKYSAIFFNTQKINNKQLRQALAYATPKTKDQNERCLGPISPESWAYNPNIKEYNFDATRAKELFQNNKIDSINLIVGDRRLLSTAEDIKKSWESILDLKTNISIINQIDTENFDAILTYGSIPHDPDQYLFWHSTQIGKNNLTKLNDSRIDKLLEDGRFAIDQIERKEIYQDFQKYLLEESPAIFLAFPNTYTINRVK
ncbi:MAG: ABC transporter substrate-binding protein [Candidatus Shapirobacteria bacterium]|nr:ABC transporter substrate-binding protein [Candidatus Shapirobacteria bacterium]